jgi:hypothetical protein
LLCPQPPTKFDFATGIDRWGKYNERPNLSRPGSNRWFPGGRAPGDSCFVNLLPLGESREGWLGGSPQLGRLLGLCFIGDQPFDFRDWRR